MNKKGWRYKKLVEVSDIQYGYPFDSKFFCDDNNYPPLIRIRDVTRGFSETYYKGDVPNEYWIHEGDYLIGMDGEFNIAKWGKKPGLLNQRVCKIEAHPDSLDGEFMMYFMKGCLKKIEDETPFVTVKHLSAKKLNQVKLALPPINEQKEIASELNAINNSITMLHLQVKDLDSLALSIFYDMFGDPITNPKGFPLIKISEVGTVVTGNTPSTKDVENYSSNDYCFIKPSDIAKEGVSNIQTSEFFISKKAYCNSRQLPKGSVLTTCIGIIGKVGILRKDATCNQQINAIVPNSDISSVYLAYTILGLRNVLEAISNAPVVPIINKGDFSKLQIPLPPQYSQQSFANKIAAIEESKASLHAQIAEMQNLLAARMQYWFD